MTTIDRSISPYLDPNWSLSPPLPSKKFFKFIWTGKEKLCIVVNRKRIGGENYCLKFCSSQDNGEVTKTLFLLFADWSAEGILPVRWQTTSQEVPLQQRVPSQDAEGWAEGKWFSHVWREGVASSKLNGQRRAGAKYRSRGA